MARRDRKSSCMLLNICFRLASGFPVVFVACLLLWAYYAYIVIVCGQIKDSLVESVILGFVFTMLWLLVVTSYYRAINTFVGEPPEKFRLSDSQIAEYDAIEDSDKTAELEAKRELLARFAADLPINMRLPNGGFRYCQPCGMLKPDRSHHCSLCKRCVLKMDHHCPWVNNCVGFGNYKFFVLFLVFTTLFCLFIAFSVLPTFIATWGDLSLGSSHSDRGRGHSSNATDPTESTKQFTTSQRLSVIFLFFLAGVFAISVSFLAIFHVYLTFNNQTTLEQGRPSHFQHGKVKDAFFLGYRKNLEQVLGKDPLYWILPVKTSLGNGYEFGTRERSGNADGAEGVCLLAGGETGPVSGDESDRV